MYMDNMLNIKLNNECDIKFKEINQNKNNK